MFLTLILIGTSSGGGVESNIRCQFPGNGHNVFWTGESVSGTIEFVNYAYKGLKLKNVNAQLIGEFVYKKQQNRKSDTPKVLERHTFFKKTLILHSGGKQKTFILSSGNHTWPFRFHLNDSLPPSFEQTNSDDPYVHYSLRIVFAIPEWYKSNIRKAFSVVVKRTPSSVNATQIKQQETNRNHVCLQILLNNSVVNIGKNFSFAVDIRNPKQHSIHRISVKLVQTKHLNINWKKEYDIINRDLEKIHQFQGTNFHEHFQLFVPSGTLPTFSLDLPSSYDKLSFVVHYTLHFEAHLPGFFTNIFLKFPLIITDHPENN